MTRAKARASTENTTDTSRMDPVVRTVIEIAKLQKRYNQLDALPKAIGSEESYREVEKKNVWDRIEILRNYLSAVRPTSLAGALALIEEISLIIDQGGLEGRQERSIRRMVFATTDVIKGFIPAQLIDDMDLNRDSNLDPWRPYEQRLAMIDDEREAA